MAIFEPTTDNEVRAKNLRLLAENEQLRDERVLDLAQQVVIALRLAEVSEQTQQTDIAKQQEKAAQERAAELAKANEALRRTTERLTQEPKLHRYLGYVLLEVCAQIGAASGHLTILNEERNVLVTVALVQDGKLIEETFPSEVALEGETFFDLLLREKGPRAFDFETESHLFYPGTWEYHQEQGHTYTYGIPLMIGDRALGHIGVALRSSARPVEQQIELLQALSQQAALAIQLTRLAEEAKQVAIAKEQEKAARERAAELAKANEALRRVNRRLARETDYNSVLNLVLSESISVMQATDAVVYRYDRLDNCLRFLGAVSDGQSVASIPGHPYAHPDRPCPISELSLWEQLKRGSIHVSRFDGAQDVPSELSRWHLSCGHTLCLRSTLVIGDEPIGWLGVAFNQRTEATEELLEEYRTLAQQATLVVQLSRLSEAAKESAARAAVTEERNRFARDLHDSMAQTFTGISLVLERARTNLPIGELNAKALACLDEARDLAHEGLEEARRSVWALRADSLQNNSLFDALQSLVARQTLPAALQADCRIRGKSCPLPPDMEDNLLKIAQEGVTNTVKHAQATRLVIELAYTPDAVLLQVTDNGRGMAPDAASLRTGFGLTGITERAAYIGGQLTITGQPGQGTSLLVRVPTPVPPHR